MSFAPQGCEACAHFSFGFCKRVLLRQSTSRVVEVGVKKLNWGLFHCVAVIDCPPFLICLFARPNQCGPTTKHLMVRLTTCAFTHALLPRTKSPASTTPLKTPVSPFFFPGLRGDANRSDGMDNGFSRLVTVCHRLALLALHDATLFF